MSDEKVDFDESEDDPLSTQDLEEFAKDMEGDPFEFQARIEEVVADQQIDVNTQDVKGKKPMDKIAEMVEGTSKSSRFEKTEDIKVDNKAISRVEAKDAFLNKGMCRGP